MDAYVVVIAAVLIVLGLLIWFWRRIDPRKAAVGRLLDKYEAFERSGLPEPERLFKLFATRGGWRSLPDPFLRELTSRLGTKEDVIRFVVITELYKLDRTHFPRFAAEGSTEDAALNVAMLLASLGNKLQQQGEYADAELAQVVAVRIEPDHHVTLLPLAVTYYVTGRYTQATPLFERGLSHLAEFQSLWEKLHEPLSTVQPGFQGLFVSPSEMVEMERIYREMYEDCLSRDRISGSG